MEQSKGNFSDLLKFGEEGEKDIALFLINKGYHVLPLYQFEADIAPKIFGDNAYVSPDLVVFKDKACTFVEVKRKTRWIKYKGVIETGCNHRTYLHYKEIAKKTGIDLFMVFKHESINPIGIYSVNVQEEGRYWDGRVNGIRKFKEMYFWPFEKLVKLN